MSEEIEKIRTESLGERKNGDVGILESSFWIIIGGIIGTVAIIIGYCKYFIDLCYKF